MGPNGRTGAHLGLRRLPPSFPSCEAGWAPPRRLAEVLLCAIAEALPLPVQDDLAVSQRRAGLRFDSNRGSLLFVGEQYDAWKVGAAVGIWKSSPRESLASLVTVPQICSAAVSIRMSVALVLLTGVLAICSCRAPRACAALAHCSATRAAADATAVSFERLDWLLSALSVATAASMAATRATDIAACTSAFCSRSSSFRLCFLSSIHFFIERPFQALVVQLRMDRLLQPYPRLKGCSNQNQSAAQ